ncbi:MAG: hypothetical protein QXF82_03080 [Nitrososphaeria archaeon]
MKPHIELIALSPRKTATIVMHDGNTNRIFEAINLVELGGYFWKDWGLVGSKATVNSRALKDELNQHIDALCLFELGEEKSIPLRALKGRRIILRRVK